MVQKKLFCETLVKPAIKNWERWMDITKASTLPLFVHVMGNVRESGDEHDHVINSRISHRLFPLAHTAFIFICRAKWITAPPFTENGRAPNLPQNRLCRGLKIDPPLITVSQPEPPSNAIQYHSFTTHITFLFLLWRVPKSYFEWFTYVLSVLTYSVHFHFPGLK